MRTAKQSLCENFDWESHNCTKLEGSVFIKSSRYIVPWEHMFKYFFKNEMSKL